MKTIEEHEAKDEILRFLVDNYSDKSITGRNIWKQVYPDLEEQLIYLLLTRIINTVDPIVKTAIYNTDLDNFDVEFQATSLTRRYLEHGGFTALYENEKKLEEENKRIQKLNNEKLLSEIHILNFQKGLGKKLTIWGFIITIIAFLTSFLTSFLFKDNENEMLKKRVEILEKQFEKTKIKTIKTKVINKKNSQ